MDSIESVLPPYLVQISFAIGGVIAGAWMIIRGRTTKSDSSIIAERETLRQQLQDAIVRDAAQKLRDDVAKVLEANREAFFKALHDQDQRIQQSHHAISDRLRNMEIENAGLKRDLAHLMSRRPLP
jgi:hypothetical protein